MSHTQERADGTPVEPVQNQGEIKKLADENISNSITSTTRTQSPPPSYPLREDSSSSNPNSPRPPPFSSLYTSTASAVEAYKTAVTETGASASVPAYAPVAPESDDNSTHSSQDVQAETKAALPQDTKGGSSKKDDDSEPPPAYSEGSSPLASFTYLMAAAGGAASILTQVQQGGAPPMNTLGGKFGSGLGFGLGLT